MTPEVVRAAIRELETEVAGMGTIGDTAFQLWYMLGTVLDGLPALQDELRGC